MVKKWLKEYINKNLYDILIVLVMIVIGVLAGVGIYIFATNDLKEELVTSARSIFEISKSEEYIKTNVILNGLETNMILLLLLTIGSITLYGRYLINFIAILKGMAISIYAAILLKIFGLGYGIIAIMLLVILVNIIYLPAFIYLVVIFLEINFNIFKARINSINTLKKMAIICRITVVFIVIFSSIVVEQIMGNIVLKIFF